MALRSLINDGEVYMSASDIVAAMRALSCANVALADMACCAPHALPYAITADELTSLADRLDCAVIDLVAVPQ